MKKTALLAATAAVAFSISPAMANGPTVLSDAELDQVVAGANPLDAIESAMLSNDNAPFEQNVNGAWVMDVGTGDQLRFNSRGIRIPAENTAGVEASPRLILTDDQDNKLISLY